MCLRAICSTSVVPPTFITATFPDSFPILCLISSPSTVVFFDSYRVSSSLILLLTRSKLPEPSIIVVESSLTITFLARPKLSVLTIFLNDNPLFSLITVPPVTIEISFNNSSTFLPWEGLFTITILVIPFMLLVKDVAIT